MKVIIVLALVACAAAVGRNRPDTHIVGGQNAGSTEWRWQVRF
jgi:hypothetical protein